MGKLTGRKVVITGAASGIGLAAARLCRQDGAAIFLLDRDDPALRRAASDVGAGHRAMDITRPEDAAAGMADAAQAMDGIDGLIHSAGVWRHAPFEDTTLEMWNEVIGTNLTGAFIICRAALPWLRRSGAASIVTVASATGILPGGPGDIAYASSKAGVIGLTRAIAKELGPKIRANVACPGPVDTPMASGLRRLEPDARKAAMEKYALQRWASPEEIARAIVFLLSDEASYMTGATVAVDGGRTFH